MRSEHIGVVVQDCLLHFHRQLFPSFRIKGLGHLRRQLFQLVAVIMPVVVAGAIQTVVGEEILRVSRGRRYHGADVNIPGRGIHADAVVIRRIVDLHIEANGPQVAWADSASSGCS